MPQTKAIINIQNIVASATLNQRVDLNAVAKSYHDVEYRPELFPGLVFRLKRPKTATLIFSTGKMVCTGAKSGKESRRAIMKVVKELKKLSRRHNHPTGVKITTFSSVLVEGATVAPNLDFGLLATVWLGHCTPIVFLSCDIQTTRPMLLHSGHFFLSPTLTIN